MKRPLLVIALSYLIGIIIEVYLPISTLLINIIIFIFITLLCCFMFRYKRYVKICIIISITILISIIRVSYLENKYNTLYKKDIDKEIKIIGIITTSLKETEYRYIVTIKVLSINGSSQYKNTKVNISIKKDEVNKLEKLSFGNKIFLKGIFNEGETKRNYKGFNYKEYLQSQEIYGIVEIENLNSIKVIEKNKVNIISTLVNKLSETIKENLQKLLPEDVSGLMIGILIGDVSDISNEVTRNFKKCNLSHMLAVSGSHISYLMIGLNLVLNKNLLGIKNCKIITIVIIIIFMMLTNMTPSVVRAGICSIIFITSSIFYRKHDTYTSIAVALLYTLIENPFSIYNIGMQLSYAGTISIIIFYQEIQKKIERKKEKNIIEKMKNYVIESISLTISANILIIPLTIYNFNTISLNFILANVLASPIMAITTVLGLFTSIISLILFPISQILSFPLKILLKILLFITEQIAKVPFSNITVITPHILIIIFMYVVIFLIYFMHRHREENRKIIKEIKIKKTIIIFLIFIIAIDFLGFKIKDNNLRIYFIDVGQGDSTLIYTATGKTILIDGGGSRDESYDVGEKIVLPYLLDRRIASLDYVMISHFDSDHAQGLKTILDKIKVKKLIISKQASPSKLYEDIIDICNKKKIEIMIVKRKSKIIIDKYTFLDIMHPGNKMLDDGKGRIKCKCNSRKIKF